MRKAEVKELVNNFVYFGEPFNPLNYISVKNKLEIDVKSEKINYPGEDSVTNFFRKKMEWVLSRIKKLNGKLEDFSVIKIIVFGKKEKIIIKYKGEIFESERVYN